MAVADAATMGIPTFVVGVATGGMGTADTTLSNMANAGGYPRAGSPTYYNVSSTADFVAVLQTLVGVAASCTFTVPEPAEQRHRSRAHRRDRRRQGAHEGYEPHQRLGLHEHRYDGRSGVWFDLRRDHERIREVRRDRLQVHHQLTPEVPMRSSIIVRVGALCAGLVVVGCGFSPGKPVSGSAGTNGATLAAAASPASATSAAPPPAGRPDRPGRQMGCATFPKSSSKLPPDILIVLDASGSMNEDQTNTSCGNQGCGATSKWALMVPAINQVVTDTQTDGELGPQVLRRQRLVRREQQRRGADRADDRDRDRDLHHGPHVCERGRVERQLDADARRRERRGHLPQRAGGDGSEPQVHRAGDGRPAELSGIGQPVEPTTRRARSPRSPPRRRPVSRRSSSASPPPAARQKRR